MNVVKISYKLSESARNAEGIRAGKMPEWIQRIGMEFADFGKVERAKLLQFWSFDHRGVMEIDLSLQAVGEAKAPSTLDARLKPEAWLDMKTVKFDQVMPNEMALNALFAQIAKRAALLKETAPKVAKAQAEAEAIEAEKARLKAEAEAVLAKADGIAGDEDALRGLLFDQTPKEVREAQLTGSGPNGQMVRIFLDRYLKPFEEARKEAKAQAEAEERAAWVEAHGSERLKLAARRGHEVGRLYILERAAKDHPGWTVDYQGEAEWRDRTNPPLAELKAAEEAERKTGRDVSLVWLTQPPLEHPRASDDYWYDEDLFEQCPALVIRWQGKDLVKTL